MGKTFLHSSFSVLFLVVQLTMALAKPVANDSETCATRRSIVQLYYNTINGTWSKEAEALPTGIHTLFTQYLCEKTGPIEILQKIIGKNNVICQQDYIYLGQSRLPLEVSCSIRLTNAGESW